MKQNPDITLPPKENCNPIEDPSTLDNLKAESIHNYLGDKLNLEFDKVTFNFFKSIFVHLMVINTAVLISANVIDR